MKIANTPSDIAICVAAYLQAGDLEGVVSMFHPECQIYFPPGEAPSLGLDGARAVFKDCVPMRPVLKSTVTSEVINGDTALLQADWAFEDAEGNVIAQGQSTYGANLSYTAIDNQRSQTVMNRLKMNRKPSQDFHWLEPDGNSTRMHVWVSD